MAGSRSRPGHLEAVLAAQPERQETGPAADLEHLGGVGGSRGDVGGDTLDERAEQEPAQGVVDAGIGNEGSSRYLVSCGGMAAASQDGDGRSSRAGHEHQLSRPDHHTSTMYPRSLAGHGSPGLALRPRLTRSG
jgi:hypothetical protein